jgi:hypothetical protein
VCSQKCGSALPGPSTVPLNVAVIDVDSLSCPIKPPNAVADGPHALAASPADVGRRRSTKRTASLQVCTVRRALRVMQKAEWTRASGARKRPCRPRTQPHALHGCGQRRCGPHQTRFDHHGRAAQSVAFVRAGRAIAMHFARCTRVVSVPSSCCTQLPQGRSGGIVGRERGWEFAAVLSACVPCVDKAMSFTSAPASDASAWSAAQAMPASRGPRQTSTRDRGAFSACADAWRFPSRGGGMG